MAHDFSKHHIVPTSMWGTNAKPNIVKLTHKYHVAFHQVFNNLPPHRQMERLLDVNSTALTEDFKRRVMETIGTNPEYVYNEGILIPRLC